MKLVSAVSKPLSSAVLASLLTALLISPQTKTEIVERVYVRDPAQPRIVREVQVINQNSCPRAAVMKAVNKALGSELRTGDGTTANKGVMPNDATSSEHDRGPSRNVGAGAQPPAVADIDSGSAGSVQEGDNSTEVDQSGVARSGDVILGQKLIQVVVCGKGEMTANNSVSDSEGRSGDASVDNDAAVNASSRPLPFPKPRRTPRPRVSPTPTPSPSSTPVRGSPV